MKRCRHCGYRESGVRFGEDKVNIQPTLQYIAKLEKLFDYLMHLKKSLIASGGLESKGVYDVMNELYMVQGNIKAEAQKLDREVGKYM